MVQVLVQIFIYLLKCHLQYIFTETAIKHEDLCLIQVDQLINRLKALEDQLSLDSCAVNPCRNGGSCIDTFQGFVCQVITYLKKKSTWNGSNAALF
jgi:hypothetical protein